MIKNDKVSSTREKYVEDTTKGFLKILHVGLGYRTGIFDYFQKKQIQLEKIEKTPFVSFQFEELSQNLGLDEKYLEAYLQLALELGFIQIEDREKRIFRTSPYIHDFFINPENPLYLGYFYKWIYKLAPMQEMIRENFKTGQIINRLDWDLLEEASLAGQRVTTRFKIQRIDMFRKRFKNVNERLENEGYLLEVGCGHGYNLSFWAQAFPNLNIVGIDIDSKRIAQAKELVKNNNWNGRINLINKSISDYARSFEQNHDFDIIVMNEVLHEIDPDEIFRLSVFDDIYSILKDDGVLFVGETMIPELFDIKHEVKWYEIVKKWDETSFGAKLYSKEGIKNLFSKTQFTKIELIREGDIYFWSLQK